MPNLLLTGDDHVWTQGRYSHCCDLDMINPKVPVNLIDDPQMLGLLRETWHEVLGPWGVSLVEIQMALGKGYTKGWA